MTQAHLLLDLDVAAVWAAWTAAVLFPFVTGFYWPWWRSEWGWNIITLEIGLALAVTPAWLHYVFGLQATSFPFRWFQVAAIFFIAFVIIWRAVLIWRTQRTAP